MVDVAAVEALYQELPGEAEVFADRQRLFVDVLGGKVFRDAAVIGVAQFDFIIFVVKQVIHVYVVHVTLNVFQIDV